MPECDSLQMVFVSLIECAELPNTTRQPLTHFVIAIDNTSTVTVDNCNTYYMNF